LGTGVWPESPALETINSGTIEHRKCGATEAQRRRPPGAPTATATAYRRWLQRILKHCALAESGLDRLRSNYQRAIGILPLLGRRRGFDRCYGSFDCVIYGLTNSGLLKRGSSEASGEAKMEVNKPIRMRVRVRNWWPPWWRLQPPLRTRGAPVVEVVGNTPEIKSEAISEPGGSDKLGCERGTQFVRRRLRRKWLRVERHLQKAAQWATRDDIVYGGKAPPDNCEQSRVEVECCFHGYVFCVFFWLFLFSVFHRVSRESVLNRPTIFRRQFAIYSLPLRWESD
jgi:hypothetical protein